MPRSAAENPLLNAADWIEATELLVTTYPNLVQPGLIVEGCMGGNEWLAYWLKTFFPSAIYVGADIAPAVRCINDQRDNRADSGVSPVQYQLLLAGQEQLTTDDGDSALVTFRANCLSEPFVRSLRDHSRAEKIWLVTFNGLVGLMGTDYVPGERKDMSDLTPLERVVDSSLFDAQLHVFESSIGASLWDSTVNVVTRWYFNTMQAASNLGKTVVKIKDGLLILR